MSKMSERRLKNFFEAYQVYAADNFIPKQFNEWGCLSIIAGALERKVWLPWFEEESYYPNIYVLFASGPGEGKSVALNRATNLLVEINKRSPGCINLMPNQATEAKFLELIGHGRQFAQGTVHTVQNAVYYRASEASSSLRNIYGEFLACLTDLYDCPKIWSRAVKKDPKPLHLQNVCVNLFAASTIDYLSELVNDKNIMGGFASRLIYVVSRDKPIVQQRFQHGGMDSEHARMRMALREDLIHDLALINKVIGPMHGDAEFGEAWEAWQFEFETKRRKLDSEKLQSLIVRTNNNMLKVSMLLSMAESDERKLCLRHWNKALELVNEVNKNIPDIFRESRASNSDKAGKNLAHAVFHMLVRNKGITRTELKGKLMRRDFNSSAIDQMINSLIEDGKIGAGSAHAGKGVALELLCDPDDYL